MDLFDGFDVLEVLGGVFGGGGRNPVRALLTVVVVVAVFLAVAWVVATYVV